MHTRPKKKTQGLDFYYTEVIFASKMWFCFVCEQNWHNTNKTEPKMNKKNAEIKLCTNLSITTKIQ